ncbi:hypothetical protein IF650_03455 [Cellulosimicrobium terreum]|nr:hypothetical protein [Cellulosimicrobium terreum]
MSALRTVVLRCHLWAAVVLPVCFVAGSALAGGGLLLAGFVLLALPAFAVLAAGPALSRWVGGVRVPDDVPLPYAVVTVWLWVALLPAGFLLTYTQPYPTDVPEPRGYDLASAVSPFFLLPVPVLWLAQVVLGILGVRLRRRTA